MTELECQDLYETGERCGRCAACLVLQGHSEWQAPDPRYGSPSDLFPS